MTRAVAVSGRFVSSEWPIPRQKGGEPGARKRVSMTLTGTCITSEETLLRQFPVRISDHLRLPTDRFDLGVMRQGESKER